MSQPLRLQAGACQRRGAHASCALSASRRGSIRSLPSRGRGPDSVLLEGCDTPLSAEFIVSAVSRAPFRRKRQDSDEWARRQWQSASRPDVSVEPRYIAKILGAQRLDWTSPSAKTSSILDVPKCPGIASWPRRTSTSGLGFLSLTCPTSCEALAAVREPSASLRTGLT